MEFFNKKKLKIIEFFNKNKKNKNHGILTTNLEGGLEQG
jgi:hypothetical protein